MRGLCLVLVLSGCQAAERPPVPLPPGSLFVSPAPSSFVAGPLEVTQVDVAEGQFGAPRPVRITAPTESGTWAVVQFQHGFLSDRRAYDEILTHLASHGFVVVAPQMYPADGVPLGKPTAAEEARVAEEVAQWSLATAPAVVGSATPAQGLGLAGHSRGGKVSWLVGAGGGRVVALFGLDPVDGRGGPLLSAQPEALPAAQDEGPPSFILGFERGGACAPEGDNFQHFFERTAPPSRLVVVQGHGHADMLDADVGSGGLCFEGPNRAAARALTGGLLAAFFRWKLQGDDTRLDELERGLVEGLEVTRASR